MNKYAFFLIVVFFAVVCVGGIAGTAPSAKAIQDHNATSTTEDMTSGQVRKIDKEAGKLTLRHERIANLNMPPMTMVFRVKDKSMLNDIQVGDKILFKAIEKNGVLTITELK